MTFTAFFWQELFNVPVLHAKWLNTLSYFENCGAKLLAKCQHPLLVPEEVLKHAAEEFRHAFYFKSLISKVYGSFIFCDSYRDLLGGFEARFYLDRLNLHISRCLKKEGLKERELKIEAYIWVTYAIEMRALEVYTSYQRALKNSVLKISIQNVLREEQEHLEEMRKELESSACKHLKGEILNIESALFHPFFKSLSKECSLYFNKGIIKKRSI